MVSCEDADAAIKGMSRSLLYMEDDGIDATTPEFRIRAGVWVGKALVDEASGLYVAAQTDIVNEYVLKTLLSGLEHSSSSSSSNVAEASQVAKDIVDMLLLRASNPTRNMKKRAKRKYLRYSQCSTGPNPQTIDYAVQICLKDEEGGLDKAREILDEYAQRPFLGAAMSETVALVEDKEAEVAAASAEAEADNVGEEEGESVDEK